MRYRDGGPSADTLISDDEQLDSAIAAFGPTVAIDTEFMRTRTFYPIPALYQLCGGDEVWLIDAQADLAFTSLAALLADPTITKVMHACSEDLEVIDVHLGVEPANLIDSQLAHAFVSVDFSLSYAAVVQAYTGVELGKHATRSDWLRRPLSAEQLHYAKDDVRYLGEVWDKLERALSDVGRLDWFREEMAYASNGLPDPPDQYYRGIKRASRLSPRRLAVLRSLAAWREREARQRDVPRARTVWDEHLVALAECDDVDRDRVVDMLPKPVARRYAAALVAAYDAGMEDPHPPEPLPSPLTQRHGEIIKRMRAYGREVAERLGMAPELLSRKRDVEACFRHYLDHGELSQPFTGWRAELVGERFVEFMSETR